MRSAVRLALASVFVMALVGWTGAPTAFAAVPGNDDFSAATVINSLPFGEVGVDTSQATIEAGEPGGGCTSTGGSVWYTMTASSDEVVRVDTSLTTDLNTVNVYAGTTIDGLNFVNCGYSFNSPTTFHASAGTTYFIQVRGTFSSPTFNISVAVVPPPANDNFSNASTIDPSALPYSSSADAIGATLEAGEPTPSCTIFGVPNNSVWYSFTPTSSRSYTLTTSSGGVPTVAFYTGATLGSLSEVGCKTLGGASVSFAATQGVTYHIQIGDYYAGAFGPTNFSLDVAPNPSAFFFSPSDPSTSDVVQFGGQSSDTGGGNPIAQELFTFGDGTSAVGCCPGTIGDVDTTHQYARDGDYTVTVTATTTDGRTASYQQVVHVATHDVSLSQLSVPMAAKTGQTKPIAVTVRNSRYPEVVRIDLYRSAGGGFELVSSLTQPVPAKGAQHPTGFSFNYTFTANDAAAGKVVFQVVATIQGARDAFPADNTAVSSAVKLQG